MGCGDMDIVRICGFGILAVVLCMTAKRLRPESAFGISAAAGVIILAAAISALAPSVSAVRELADAAGVDGELVGILFKALAVCYIVSLSADCARDAGEAALGARLELAGRAAIAAISLPAFVELASIVTGLINGN